jgi:hypothetical protein
MEDTHGQLLLNSIATAVCSIIALLAFFFWLARGSKNKPSIRGDNKRKIQLRRKRKKKNSS